jgi:isochorismate synthase
MNMAVVNPIGSVEASTGAAASAPRHPFLLADRNIVLAARGAVRRMPSVTIDEAASAASTHFQAAEGAEPRTIVGALPFDRGAPVRLYTPEIVDRVPAAQWAASRSGAPDVNELGATTASDGDPRVSMDRGTIRAMPSRTEYAESVLRALAALKADPQLLKVVLARRLMLSAAERIDVDGVLARLEADGSATTFCVPLPASVSGEVGDWSDAVFVGATPELLVEREGRSVVSHPLAGSARRHADPSADRAAAESLMRSDKDRREHAYVIESIADALAPYCRQLRVPSEPSLASTASLWHLATKVEGELRSDSTSSLELASLLHPTPAVCGWPTQQGRELIQELEPFDRGYYAGAVGWCDERGDGRWMVALRCAVISGNTAELFAGAGIVAGSDPEAEAAETSLKFSAMLDALGIDVSGELMRGVSP